MSSGDGEVTSEQPADQPSTSGNAVMQSRSLPRMGSLLPGVFTNSPQQSWEDWKEDFQADAGVNVWTDDEMRHVLTLRLRGPDREALRDITEDKKSTFSTLLAALNERFVPPTRQS